MDFTPFLRIKPELEVALATVDREVTEAKGVLDAAQQDYERLTTQACNLRLVRDMLAEVEKAITH